MLQVLEENSGYAEKMKNWGQVLVCLKISTSLVDFRCVEMEHWFEVTD